MPNEEVHLSNGLKSVDSPESSNVVENSSCVEKCNSSNDFCSIAKGVEKAHCFSVDVTTNTSRQQSSEAPLESDLPFIKSSCMWPGAESMKVFQSMPQQPHFIPLKEQDELLREGKAIGLMLSFTKLVEATQIAQFEDSRTIFNMKFEVLQILEEHGFSVQPIRSRLAELLRIKESCGQWPVDNSYLGGGRRTRISCPVGHGYPNAQGEGDEASVQIEESIRAARSNFDELVAAPW